MKKIKISVYGSADGDSVKGNIPKAKEVGRIIAQNNCILVTGACNGIPYEAVLGASDLSGESIGFSPAVDNNQHIKYGLPVAGFSKIIYVPKEFDYSSNLFVCRKYRNISSAAFCDACIIISGRIGTLNEFTNAYDMEKVIGVLSDTGGVADDIIPWIIKTTDKKNGAVVLFDSKPEELIKKVLQEVNKK